MKQGIAIFDCPDHYACLGLMIGASKGEIRKRYFKIARCLHPDSCLDGMDKVQASQMLSKVVNPAYEVLSHEKDLEEYKVLLRLIGQRASREVAANTLSTPGAQTILTASDSDLTDLYQQHVNQLAQNQFEHLDNAHTIIGQLSELNLAYLMRREGEKATASSKPVAQAGNVQSAPSSQQTAVSPTARDKVQSSSQEASSQFVNDYCRRAEELIKKNRLNDAIVELRDALKLEPKNSRCHSLMGSIYLKKNSVKMAKVHFKQALNSNPQDTEALKGMKIVDKAEKRSQPSAKQSPSNPPERKKGLFGLFGGKK